MKYAGSPSFTTNFFTYINNSEGYFWGYCGRVATDVFTGGAYGSGTLMQATFKVKSVGNSLLHIMETEDTFLYTYYSLNGFVGIPFLSIDGWYGSQQKDKDEDFSICLVERDQLFPEVDFNGNEFLVVWQGYHILNQWGIYGQRVSSSGSLIGPNFTIYAPASFGVFSPAVSWNGSNYLVAYGLRVPGDSVATRIGGRIISETGGVGSSIAIAYADTFRRDPDIAWNGNNWLVVWEDYRNGGYKCAIYGKLVSATSDTSPTIAICSGYDYYYVKSAPSVASDGSDYLVVWADSKNSHILQIWGQLIASNGSLVGSNFYIQGSTLSSWYPDVAWNGISYLVVWQDRRSNYWDIYGRRVSQTGTPLGSSFPISPGSTGNIARVFPRVVREGANFIVVWTDNRSGMLSGIYGQRVSASGTLIGSNFVISDNLYHQALPGIAMGDSSLVVWSDFRNGTDYNIWGKMVPPPPPEGVEEQALSKPHKFLLHSYPNPFSPDKVGTIRYQMPAESKISLRIYDLSGRLVKILVDEVKEQGCYSIEWNIENVENGVYFYRLECEGEILTGKMIVMK